jgi:signal transduction histidine kinase
MSKPLRLLLVEDSEDDAALLLRNLRLGGYEVHVHRVEEAAEFRAALGQEVWDAIIADYNMPRFGALPALDLMLLGGYDLPFLIVSGAIGEQTAVEAMKAGAHDYIMKDNLARLAPAIDRELREAASRRERRQAVEQLQLSHEQLRQLAARLQDARERERAHIAREVHDELGQVLTGLKMDLQRLASELPREAPLLLPRADEMMQLIDSAVSTVRKISTELRPGILDNLGLSAAIEWQAKEFQTRTRVYCETVAPFEELDLDRERATAVFRIFQETLTNVARHAQATRVGVSLSRQNGAIYLKVQDNGRGITDKEQGNPHSLGLLGMRERALMFGGEVQIAGWPGRGTTVTLKMPAETESKESM